MKFGFRPVQNPLRFQEALEQAELAEEVGFDSIWVAEHHGPHEAYSPSPLLSLAAFAARTRRVKLGVCVLLLPLYPPTQVAEEAALVDVFSGGRLILGIGTGGSHTRDFDAYGIPVADRFSRLEESISLLRRLWAGEEVTHEGRHFRVESFTLGPLPRQPGGPPLWIGARGPRSIRRAARLGDALLTVIMAPLDALVEHRRIYEESVRALGRDPSRAAVPIVREVYVGETRKEAETRARRLIGGLYQKIYWPWDLAAPVDESIGLQPAWVVGDVETVVQTIRGYEEKLGATHLICRMVYPGMSPKEAREAIERFGREVIPRFRDDA